MVRVSLIKSLIHGQLNIIDVYFFISTA